MFERFTERSRRVVVLAQEEARLLDHNYIGTEHILLGLIHEGDGVAARAIESFGLTLDAARTQVREIIGVGQQAPLGHIPFTPRAKKVLELGLREALKLRKSYIGTEHILLGLLTEGHGVGVQILERVAAPRPAIRAKVLELAGDEGPGADPDNPDVAWMSPGSPAGVSARPLRVQVQRLSEVRDVLASIDRRLAAIERHLGIASEETERHPDIATEETATEAASEETAAPEESAE